MSETIHNEAREQKSGFYSPLLGILGASLLGNLLTGKRVMRTSEGALPTSWRQSTVRVRKDF